MYHPTTLWLQNQVLDHQVLKDTAGEKPDPFSHGRPEQQAPPIDLCAIVLSYKLPLLLLLLLCMSFIVCV